MSERGVSGSVDMVERAVEFLAATYCEERALFPYSSRYHDGEYASSYEHPLAVRYTLISLLGLHRALREAPRDDFRARAGELVARAAEAHGARLSSEADAGLLLLLLSEATTRPAQRAELASRVLATVAGSGARRLTMQDLGWMLWGTVAAARTGTPQAADAAAAVHALVAGDFVDRVSQMPRHALARARRRLVSFGSLTYYVRSRREWAEYAGDEQAARATDAALATALALQGPLGQWPWLLDTRRAVILDAYPIFSVHQLSMAMLFLLGVADAGSEAARSAIERSFAWVRGENELGRAIAVDDGRFVYRSLETRPREANRFSRGIRYGRTMPRAVAHRPDEWRRRRRVYVNPESRSYEWGWLLYAWSGRADQPPAA